MNFYSSTKVLTTKMCSSGLSKMITLLLSLVCCQYLASAKTVENPIYFNGSSVETDHGGWSQVSNSWFAAVKENDFEQAYSYWKQLANSELRVQDAVKLAYNGTANTVHNICVFLSKIHNAKYTYLGLKTLRNEMRDHGQEQTSEMMHLIYFIKLAMTEYLSPNLTIRYRKLTNALPSEMKAIIFADNVVINSEEFKEFLYERSITESHGGLQLLWKTGDAVSNGIYYFDVGLEGDRLYYIIRNDYNRRGAPICPHEHDKDNKKIVSCFDRTGKQLWWYVEPVGSSFRFKTWLDGLFMHASIWNFDKERRRALLHLHPDDGTKTDRHWKICTENNWTACKRK